MFPLATEAHGFGIYDRNDPEKNSNKKIVERHNSILPLFPSQWLRLNDHAVLEIRFT